ncbi:zinc finger protein 184-like [Cheilinus undulatus]|uniref:zinc finger protein 184-like n=1 Tax=Cheilinus undulatus TaxID=241271 RepID=UPI001BD3C09E|nr:zinc finger protein 184-like [Cheilinus undulatus]
MSKFQMLRSLVNQRLTAAAEEIFELFERTIAEYEDQLRSKENQHKRLEAVISPEVELHRPDVQQLIVRKEEVLPEQQVWSHGPQQEDPPGPAHIKEEWEELWTHGEEEQLRGTVGADINMFTFTPVRVKCEEEEEPHSSQLHQRQTDQMETGADGENSGVARHFNPNSHLQQAAHDKTQQSFESETDDSNCDWDEPREAQLGLNPLQNKDQCIIDMKFNNGNTSFSSTECAQSSEQKKQTQEQKGNHTEKVSCPVCGNWYPNKRYLQQHMLRHSVKKPFCCSFCRKSFHSRTDMVRHMRVHTGEKPFSCEVCGKRFSLHGNLRQHMIIHKEEKPFTCSICDRKFNWQISFKKHTNVCKGSKTE